MSSNNLRAMNIDNSGNIAGETDAQADFAPKPMIIGGRVFDFSKRIYIMGILNVTPDSFSDGGRCYRRLDALNHADKMIKAGADIIDVGGESSRPGAQPVDLKVEMSRVVPVIREIRKNYDIPVSVDTYKAEVAKAAIDAGADIINDISALSMDPKMREVAANADLPVILMHMKGTPTNMQKKPSYDSLMSEVYNYLRGAIDAALKAGIREDKIIVDPGIGFGKTTSHNCTIIKNLRWLKSLNRPILVGLSRKSFIGEITGQQVNDRMYGTVAANVISVLNGANILRVHDVKENIQAVKVTELLHGRLRGIKPKTRAGEPVKL